MATRIFLFTGCVYGALGVAGMALSAHLNVPATAGTASQMMLLHAPALVALSIGQAQGYFERYSGFLALLAMMVGVFFFSGAVWFKAATGKSFLPYLAPAGGFLLMGAWVVLAIAALIRFRR